MDRITQEAHHRQRILKYAEKYGVTRASIRYKVSRKTVHKWKKRYDGSIESLKDRERAPHRIARKQTPGELKLVKRYARKYAGDMLLGFEKARAYGYTRSYGCFKRTAAKLLKPEKKRKKIRKNKPYQRAEYPGQKIQMDVKYVPSYCVVNGEKYYQFTAKDECTRWTYREMYAERSTASAKDFLEKLVRNAPFPIRMIQTDNGPEFLDYEGLRRSIHGGTRFNVYYCHSYASWEKGTIERNNRIIRRFFPKGTDFRHVTKKQVAAVQDWMNNYPRKILDWKTPAEMTA